MALVTGEEAAGGPLWSLAGLPARSPAAEEKGKYAVTVSAGECGTDC